MLHWKLPDDTDGAHSERQSVNTALFALSASFDMLNQRLLQPRLGWYQDVLTSVSGSCVLYIQSVDQDITNQALLQLLSNSVTGNPCFNALSPSLSRDGWPYQSTVGRWEALPWRWPFCSRVRWELTRSGVWVGSEGRLQAYYVETDVFFYWIMCLSSTCLTVV